MSTPDGITAPHSATFLPSPPTTSTSTIKRKRGNSPENADSNGVLPLHQTNGTERRINGFQGTLDNILEVLKRQDTKPSILHHVLPSDRPHLNEPPAKRTKLSQSPSADDTIAAKVEKRAYSSLDELAKDVDTVTSQLLAPIKSKEHLASTALHTRHLPAAPEDNEFISKVLTFKKTLKTLLLPSTRDAKSNLKNGYTNGVKHGPEGNVESRKIHLDTAEAGSPPTDDDLESRAVLTLYGNAQGPKQLFSSLQRPIRGKRPPTSGSIGGAVIPLRESALPNGISTTKIIPAKPEGPSGKEAKRTFGSVFGPPANIPQLLPPKPSRSTTTRGSTVGWTESEQVSKSLRKGGYTTQNLSTGQWLGYDGVAAVQEAPTPEAKRKQRDRALSTGETESGLSDEAVAASEHAKAEALFRRAYSSFAPDHDDTGAVVPQEIKNRVWWHKVGQKRFVEAFAMDPALLEHEVDTFTDRDILSGDVDEEQQFKEAVENYVPELDAPLELMSGQSSVRSVEQKLEEIAELLETLHSYQRIRNASLVSTPRNALSQSSPPTSGTPSTPSAEETTVYLDIRNRLVALISSLPPYAVAKLNGQQDADLIISRKITIESSDHHGVMEADQAARLAKAAALSAASNIPVARTSSNTAGSQYAPRTAPMSQPPPRSTTQSQRYYPQQQPPARSPSWTNGRPQSGTTQVQQPSRMPPTTAARPTYTPQPYRPQNSSYSQSTPQYSQQRPLSNGYGHSTPYSQSAYSQSTPYQQTSSRSLQQPSQPAYQQRVQTNTQLPSYNRPLQTPNPSPYGRAPSPPRAAPPHTPQHYYQQQSQRPPFYGMQAGGQSQPQPQPQTQQRPQYPLHTSSTPASYPSVNQANGSYLPPAPQMNNSTGTPQLGPSGYVAATGIDSQHGNNMQRPVSRQGTGTPQPYGPQYGGQINGTPGVTA